MKTMTSDVVRQFAIDIERLQKQCRNNTIANVILTAGLVVCAAELYLIEHESEKDDKKKSKNSK